MTHLSQIDFHGDTLFAHEHDGEIYVLMRQVCDNLGLDWEGQRQRIKRNEVLGPSAFMIKVDDVAGKTRDQLALPLYLLNGWLFGVDASRVRNEIRAKLIEYQSECHQVLARHFLKPPLPTFSSSPRLPLAEDLSQRLEYVREVRLVHGRAAAQQAWHDLGLLPVGRSIASPVAQLRDWIDLALIPAENTRIPMRQVFDRATEELGFDVGGRLWDEAAPDWAQQRKSARYKRTTHRCIMGVNWAV